MKKLFLCIVVCLSVLLVACGGNTSGTPTPATTIIPSGTTHLTPSVEPFPSVTGTVPAWGVQMQTSKCIAHMTYPDKSCTPGDIFPNATAAIICVPGYTKSVRNVTAQDKANIEAAYSVVYNPTVPQEIDHFVPLELGGTNSYANLWPEFAPQYHQKDATENYLHGLVCHGKMSLLQAQTFIATNWVAVYSAMPAACKQPYPATGCTYGTNGVDSGT